LIKCCSQDLFPSAAASAFYVEIKLPIGFYFSLESE
jgi:hypothetical protein